MSQRKMCFLLALLVTAAVIAAKKCERKPENLSQDPSEVGDKFQLILSNFNRTYQFSTYLPDTKYLVTLKSTDPTRKFIQFMLVAENDNTGQSGTFELYEYEKELTKFSDKCDDAVIEKSNIPKDYVSVIWMSPPKDSGTVYIRATVVESQFAWYMDDQDLTIEINQNPIVLTDDPGPVYEECCACDEAKYEVTFEGLWSRNTHPKDFPSKAGSTRFSDVIGASHTYDYRFWEYSGNASNGLRQVAEKGTTRDLESELKNQSKHIRTIIKARGISYPNVTGKTFAVFRVDRKHHLMSLVSMIEPSPDWFVGVSGLELCQLNCSWIEHKELNMYPYDAGTDSGISYTDADSETIPQEPIRRITSTDPDNPKSPFYDANGVNMKPIAKLYLNRQRLYEKTCEEPTSEPNPENCVMSDWGEWGECTATCGKAQQLRQRKYLDPEMASASNCRQPVTDRRRCSVPHCSRNPDLLNPEQCVLDQWSGWSDCTTTCGRGMRTRQRKFHHKKHRKRCMAAPDAPELQETIICEENEPCADDSGHEEVSTTSDSSSEGYDNCEPECVTKPVDDVTSPDGGKECLDEQFQPWSTWTPCSVSCGIGTVQRQRHILHNLGNIVAADQRDIEKCLSEETLCTAELSSCEITDDLAKSLCSDPLMVGRCNNNIQRYYFDNMAGSCLPFNYSGCDGSKNNFEDERTCNYVCGSFQTQVTANPFESETMTENLKTTTESHQNGRCKTTEWSEWTSCTDCSGFSTKTREIVPEEENPEKCEKKLVKKRKCGKRPECSAEKKSGKRRSYRDHNTVMDRNKIHKDSVDCKVSSWSIWSRCTSTCGNAVQHRTRKIRIHPRGPEGEPCPRRVEFRDCPTLPCPQ